MEDNNCIFCKIIRNEIPSIKIYEDDECLVILDIFPATRGQSLVISKEHISYIFDLDNSKYGHLFEISKRIGKAIDESLKTLRTCIVVEGFDVPHVHIKLYPSYEKKLLTHGNKVKTEELEEIAKDIKKELL